MSLNRLVKETGGNSRGLSGSRFSPVALTVAVARSVPSKQLISRRSRFSAFGGYGMGLTLHPSRQSSRSSFTLSDRVKLGSPLSLLGFTLLGGMKIDYRGERIAQLVPAPVLKARWAEVEALGETARGNGGFGSTGR